MPNKPGQLINSTDSFLNGLLFREVDNRMLAIFRFLFGFLMSIHCILAIYQGQVNRNFIAVPFTFNYIGFDFLQPLPGQGMYLYFGFMAFVAILVMIGYRYRISSLTLAIMWTIVYLMQKMDYNNHYYLMVLLCWIMYIVPAHHRFSADARNGRIISSYRCQQWVPLLLISLTGIMYLFAGISKFDPDWISGRFLHIMFSRYRNHQYLGELYSSTLFAQWISYAGLLFDLLIVPALLWKRSRKWAFILSCFFHLFNSYTFHIGIFPYLGMALNIIFFMPVSAGFHADKKWTVGATPNNNISHSLNRRLISIGLTAFMIIQILLPLRHYLFPGNVFWSDEGYRMSWKMMGRTKSGWVKFKITDSKGGLIEYADPAHELSTTHCMWLAGSPDMIWQYAQRLKKRYFKKEHKVVGVYAVGEVSLNRRQPQPLVDSTIDLANISWEPFKHAHWIIPCKDK